MKYMWVLGLLCCTGTVWASEVIPEVVPPQTTPVVSTLVGIVNKLEPTEEYVFLFRHPSFLGTSASVARLTSRHYPIASLRIGFQDSQPVTTPYLSESFDLPGIVSRFTPDTVKSYLTSPYVFSILQFVGKYARLGLVEAYAFDRGKLEIGASVGATFVKSF